MEKGLECHQQLTGLNKKRYQLSNNIIDIKPDDHWKLEKTRRNIKKL